MPGEYHITVRVSDGKGGNAKGSGTVLAGLNGLEYIRIFPRVAEMKPAKSCASEPRVFIRTAT